MRNNVMNDAKVEKDKNYISKFDLSAGNSNTASVGRVDIGFSQVLVPGSKMLLKQEQLVRMAPLVAPTYAKQYFKTWGMQIPIEDIWPNFSPMMTKESVARNGSLIIPEKTPHMKANHLLAFCLTGAHVSVFRERTSALDNNASRALENSSQWETKPYSTDVGVPVDTLWQDWCNTILGACGYSVSNGLASINFGYILGLDDENFTLPVNNYGVSSFFPPSASSGPLSFYDSDLVLKPDFSIIRRVPITLGENGQNVYDGNDMVRFNIRLSSFGRQIYKNLRALGYPCDFGNTSLRTVLHLFAAYKAYWDIFGLNQFQNWEETNASRILTYLVNNPNRMELYGQLPSAQWTVFRNFMLEEFGQMWVTEKDDYVSAHLPQPTISPEFTGVYGVADAQPNNGDVGGVLNSDIIKQYNSSTQNPLQPADPVDGLSVPDGHAYMNTLYHSHLDSEALKRLYKMTNRNTMLGREIAKLMVARGLGTYMQRTRTNMIGETTMTLDISPVFSTSDTYNEASDSGSEVGDYAGKGVGYRKDDKSMFCKTETFCFVIVLTAITSDSGYSQGEDITTRCVDSDDVYQPAFEALGQELHEKSVVVSTSDGAVIDRKDTEDGWKPDLKTDGSLKAFGYATRYAGWKVGRSCSNGGFALASTRDNFIPFIGDKLIFPEERLDIEQTDLASQETFRVWTSFRLLSFENLPTAGNAWRFLMRYPWMQNLLRIFRSKGKQYVGAILASDSSLAMFEKLYLVPENYMIFDDIWCKVWSPMLPIAETYGTIDPDKKELEFVDRA